MTQVEILDKARDLKSEVSVQYTGEKVIELANKGLELLGNQDLGSEGLELKESFLNTLIQFHVMNYRGDLAFPYLISYKNLANIDEKKQKNFADLLQICLPQLAEVEAIPDAELFGMIDEVKQSLTLEEDHFDLAFSLLQVHQIRQHNTKVERLKRLLLDKALPIEEHRSPCEACQLNMVIRKQLLLGLIKEAEQTFDQLMNTKRFRCARSPRTATAALLNYHLANDDLEAAKTYADILAQHIDFGWKAGICFANPLFEYLVRTGDLEAARYWYDRFEAEMRNSILSKQKERFWKWAESIHPIAKAV